MPIILDRRIGGDRKRVGDGVTDDDDRCRTMAPDGWKPRSTGSRSIPAPTFPPPDSRAVYPEVAIVFEVTEPERHHRVPLLLSPFAYSTYQGS